MFKKRRWSKRLVPRKITTWRTRKKQYIEKYKEIIEKELKESEENGPIIIFD